MQRIKKPDANKLVETGFRDCYKGSLDRFDYFAYCNDGRSKRLLLLMFNWHFEIPFIIMSYTLNSI